MTKEEFEVVKLTPREAWELKQELEAIEADYLDWIERHKGDYQGDYWD